MYQHDMVRMPSRNIPMITAASARNESFGYSRRVHREQTMLERTKVSATNTLPGMTPVPNSFMTVKSRRTWPGGVSISGGESGRKAATYPLPRASDFASA